MDYSLTANKTTFSFVEHLILHAQLQEAQLLLMAKNGAVLFNQ